MERDTYAGPSRSSVVKDEKRNTKRKRNAIASSSTINPAPVPDQRQETSKAERNKAKFQEWKQRKRKRDRATQHVDETSSPRPPPAVVARPCASEEEDMTHTVMFTTSTGKLVTSANLGTIFTKYLQAFQEDPASFQATYHYTLVPPDIINKKWKPDPNQAHQPPPDSMYSCTLVMPEGMEPSHAVSTPPGYRSKSLAKRDAMSVMVRTLMDAGQISQDLVPKPSGPDVKTIGAKDRKDLVWFENQEKLGNIIDPSALSSGSTLNERWAAFKVGIRDRLPELPQSVNGNKGVFDCIPISSPTFWDDSPAFTSSTAFYPTIIQLEIEGFAHECRDLCLLTTRPIPDTESGRTFDLTIRGKEYATFDVVPAKVVLRGGSAITKLSEDQVNAAFRFTQSILNYHIAHPVISNLRECRWLVLPMQQGHNATMHTKVKRRHVDWDQIGMVIGQEPRPVNRDELLSNTTESGSDAMYGTADSNRLVYLHRPSSTESCPEDLLKGSIALPGRKGGIVNELSSASNPLPNLNDIRTRHPISPSVYRTTSMLPTILNQIDTYLIARQASEVLLGSAADTSTTLQALTPRKTSGDLLNSYERLEFLGDTLLKLIGTVDVFARPPEKLRSVEVDKERHLMLSNRMLHSCSEKAGLLPYIRNEKFMAKDWMPVGWKFEDGTAKEAKSQVLGLKIAADVVEALIGAAYLSQSRTLDSAIRAVRDLCIPLAAIHTWSDAAAAAIRDAEPPAATPADTEGWLGVLTKPSLKVFGYQFKDPRMGQVVLNRTADPGRRDALLKYKLLGNAILEYFVVQDLWDRYPNAGPPALTNMKHSRISERTLSAFCALTPAFDQLINIEKTVEPSYRKYRNLVKAARDRADKEIAEASSCGELDELSEVGKDWWDDIPHTHILGDVIEGIAGAVLIDSGYDVEACRRIYTEYLVPLFDKYCYGPHEEGRNPKDILYKVMAQRRCTHFQVRRDAINPETNEFEATVIIHGQEVEKGSGPWSELSVRRACAQVMKKIKGEPSWIEEVCSCKPKSRSETPA